MLEKDLEGQRCGAKKLYPHPKTPNPKVQNQGKENQVQEQYLMFLVKREESRGFDVYFCVFFCVWKRGKMCRKHLGRDKNPKKCGLLQSEGCLGPFIALTHFSRQSPLQGHRQPFKGRHLQKAMDWVDLDTLGNILTSCF